MGVISDLTIKNRIRKLTNKKTDLMDDAGSINNINKKINSAMDDVEAFFICGGRAITSKLEGYKEPCQANDSTLQSAAYHIQREIDYLNRKLAECNCDGGGGGSW